MRTLSIVFLGTTLLAFSPATASAEEGSSGSAYTSAGGITDSSAKQRDQMISVFAVLPWYYGIGVGAGVRYTLPIVHDGFIKSINDSVELEFGADAWYGQAFYYSNAYGYYGSYSSTSLSIPAEGRWTFHLTDRFDVYAKLGVGLGMQFITQPGYSPAPAFYPVFIGGTGLLFRVADKISLRAEIGSFGLRGGVGFAF